MKTKIGVFILLCILGAVFILSLGYTKGSTYTVKVTPQDYSCEHADGYDCEPTVVPRKPCVGLIDPLTADPCG